MRGTHGTPTQVVLSVNTGRTRGYFHNGKAKESAIWKEPVPEHIKVGILGIECDEQAERGHGGIDQAVYVYSREDYAYWEKELGQDLSPGTFGENLTTERLDISSVLCGARIRFGTALLEATHPRLPCSTFEYRMGIKGWIARFNEGRRPGSYFRVIEEGEVAPGDPVEIVSKPDSQLTVYEMFRIRVFEQERAEEMLGAPGLSEKWRQWASSVAVP